LAYSINAKVKGRQRVIVSGAKRGEDALVTGVGIEG